MWKKVSFCLYMALLVAVVQSYGQTEPAADTPVGKIYGKFLRRMRHSMAAMDRRLTRQSEKLLTKMSRLEQGMSANLAVTDSVGSRRLFDASEGRYEGFRQQLTKDTGNLNIPMGSEYMPYIDSLQNSLSFLQKNPALMISGSGQLQSTLTQFQAFQAKIRDAEQIKSYIRERRQQIGDYVSQHMDASKLLGSQYRDMGKQAYYYSQRLGGYKKMLNDPDELAKNVLVILNQIPAFQIFMRNNSQIAGLFSLPGNYGSPGSTAGLQTRDQVSALLQDQVGGASGQAALQSAVSSAQSQLDGYKDKLSRLGGGSGDVDMPDFKPNDQKAKTFWKRLEYGANFQTTKNNYYFPTISDLGLSLGYKLNDRSTVGIGISYKLGWGNGINDIHFSSQGIGLRSFVDIKLKGSWFVSGGMEYNYTRAFQSLQQVRRIEDWSQSGLIGISKIVSMKSRTFKKTKLQLLWDFLSYQQIPRTPAVLFRVGYTF